MSKSAPEPRETSAFTSQLLLAYLERRGGRPAVDAVLRACGLQDAEDALRDEGRWFSYATKVALFDAAVAELGDPRAIRKMGAEAVELGVGSALKLALRALGSPRLVYQNIPRANAKFTGSHAMEVLDLGRDRARIAYRPLRDAPFHPLDCDYNQGMLACVPRLFGLPPARVTHRTCMGDGAEECVYDLRWAGRRHRLRRGGRRPGRHELEATILEQRETAERLAASMQDLVSELRLEDLLAKIIRHAQAAVGGNEFALLSVEGGELRCRSDSGLPRDVVAALEAWAAATPALLEEPLVLDDLAAVPALAALPVHPDAPLATLCAAPVSARGEALGVLIAFAIQPSTFLADDVALIRSYATQVAIAVANARLYEAQARLATRDALTGLHNHREFHEMLERELERGRRHGEECAVVLLDLDGFKLVNDLAGHAEGDRVLRDVAAALAGCCRSSDVAFRIGGDEFALLLPVTGPEDAALVAERARSAVAAVDPRASAACGVASWPHDGWGKDVLLAHADAAMYEMKRGARARRGGGEHGRLAIAGRLSARLTTVADVAEIGRVVTEELELGFGYELACLMRLEDDVLRIVAGSGGLSRRVDLGAWSQPADAGVCGRVVRERRAELVQDTGAEAAHLGPAELRSELAVPVLVGERVWGVLDLEATTTGAFDAEDLLLLETVAAQVAGALHRVELGAALAASVTLLTRARSADASSI